MILRSLTLEDVGPYAGRQTLQFSSDETRPVTLVGGLNGAGKTTIIRSLFHGLYGARALGVLGRKGSYGAFLDDLSNGNSMKSVLELELELPGVRQSAQLLVRRSWRTPSKGRDELDVYVAGSYDEDLSESWAEVIEGTVPLGIARLFFFDGEQIEALADLDEAADTLRTAVRSLLGLELVDTLWSDLVAVQRRVMKESKSGPDLAELERRQARLDAQQSMRVEAVRRVDELDQAVAVAVSERSRIQDALRAAGGDLVADRDAIEVERASALEAESREIERLQELASATETPLLLVDDLLRDTLQGIGLQDRRTALAEVDRTLTARDRWLVDNLPTGAQSSRDELQTLLHADRESRRKSLENLAPVEYDASRERVRLLLEDTLPERRGETLRVLGDLDAALTVVDDFDRRLARIPSTESVSILLDAASQADVRLADARAALDEATQFAAVAEGSLKRAADMRDTEMARLAGTEDAAEQDQRVARQAETAKSVLSKFGDKIAARHVSRIATFASESLAALLRKDSLIRELKIDPGTFRMSLFGFDGREIHPSALSAGERQIVALAVLWGLARAAGRPLPVVIDTPLGRLDAGHRRHIVERYLPHASHQVVVLSTDTEIDGDLHAMLTENVGEEFRINQDADGRSTFEPGYFEVHSA